MNGRRCVLAALLVAGVVALGGCAGVSKSVLPSSTTGDARSRFAATPAKGKAIVVVVVPTAPNDRMLASRRIPAYVSVATKGMTVEFKRGGKVATSDTIALKTGSPGCSTVTAGTSCRLVVPLKACGSGNNCYIANVSTYDAVKCKGKPVTCTIPSRAHELSREQNYPVGIFAGQNTKLALALAGIPVKTRVVSADAVTRATPNGVFNLIGIGPHAFAAEFYDADGNIITGPGAPTVALTAPAGSLFPVTVATPSAGSNEIYVTPPSTFNGSGLATFTVAPTFAGQATNGCKASDANCAPASVNVNMIQLVAISASDGLQLYALGDSSPLTTLEGGLTSVAGDAAGNLYTGDDDNPSIRSGPESLVAFAPPFVEGMSPTQALSDGGLLSLVQVPNQTIYSQIFVGSLFDSSYYTQFCSNVACTRSVTSPPDSDQYTSIAADSAGDYALGLQGSTCRAQINAAIVTFSPTFPCAQSMAFDSSGDLFITIPSNNQIIEASKSSNYTTLTTISTGTTVPYHLAVDGGGNLVYAGQDSLTLAATLAETLATTLAANQGGTIAAPDHSIALGTPSSGQGTASEAISIVGETLYAQFSFLNATTGSFAYYNMPDLTQNFSTIPNAATLPTGLVVLP